MEISFIFVIILLVNYMDDGLIKLIDELINLLDNNSSLKKIEVLKNEIYNDKELSKKIELFKKLNIYDSNYLEMKKDIMSNPKIKEFKYNESNLFLLTMAINKKLNSLIEKKGCFNENN